METITIWFHVAAVRLQVCLSVRLVRLKSSREMWNWVWKWVWKASGDLSLSAFYGNAARLIVTSCSAVFMYHLWAKDVKAYWVKPVSLHLCGVRP